MEILSAIVKRRSVRCYKPDIIPDEVLNRLLEAARLAPSARNLQNHKFIVVKDEGSRKALSQATDYPWIAQAPVVMVAIATNTDYVMRGGIAAYIVDVSIAVDHVILQATQEGLGTCWIGAFNQEKVRETLRVPDDYKILFLLPIGYAAETPVQKPRKDINEIVCFEHL